MWQIDKKIKEYSFKQLRKGLKLKILETVADAKEAAALTRGKQWVKLKMFGL